jgi:hypothetical protein
MLLPFAGDAAQKRLPIGWRVTDAIGSSVWAAWTTICKNCKRRRENVAEQKSNPVTGSSDREIVISRVLDAPRALVFTITISTWMSEPAARGNSPCTARMEWITKTASCSSKWSRLQELLARMDGHSG